MSSGAKSFLATALFVAILSLWFARSLVAIAPEGSSGATRPIEYRRIYVPADKSDVWPRDGEKFIPIEAQEFDALISAANATASLSEAGATIERADYSAHFDTNRELKGEAHWKIALHGTRPAIVPLTDTSLRFHDVHWHDGPQEHVRIGYWGRNGEPTNRMGIEINRSGIVDLQWTIHTKQSATEVDAPWHVPPANLTRLSLDLSPAQSPQIYGAVAIEEEARKKGSSVQSNQLRHWAFALSPTVEVVRLINRERKGPEEEPDLSIQESTNYHIDARGLEITSIWELGGAVHLKRELNVSLPNGVRLTGVDENGHELRWRSTPSSSKNSKLYSVELPSGPKSKPRRFTVKAWQPLTLNSSWRLPLISPEGVSWSSGKFDLSISPAFELQRLDPNGCIEVAVGGLEDTTQHEELHSFEAYQSAASLEVTLAARRPALTIRAGASLTLADPDLKGRLITQLIVSGGSTRHLSGRLAPDWIVESVETIPAEAMGEWFVDRRGNRQQIELQLARAATPERSISVIITGRLQRFSLNETIPSATLKMVDWLDAKVSRHLLAFQPNEPYGVENVGHLSRLSAESLDQIDRPLLEPTINNENIFDLLAAPANSGLQLTFQRGQYSADFEVSATIANQELEREYRVRVTPSSGTIEQILVYSTSALGNVHWSLAGSNEPITAERLAADDLRANNLPTGGELWVAHLRHPSADPFELTVRGQSKQIANRSLPLLCCPQAIDQHGRVDLQCADQQMPVLETYALTPIPLPDESSVVGRPLQAPMRAAFRYEPLQCRDSARTPRLAVSPENSRQKHHVTIQRVDLDSFYYCDGRGTHRATYKIDNDTDSVFPAGLPPEASLLSVNADDQPLNSSSSLWNATTGELHVPAKAGGSKVSISFVTEGAPLAAGRELPPPLDFRQLSFASGDWRIHVPEEFSLTGADNSPARSRFNWRERIFGPLGRPFASSPFNPVSLIDGAIALTDDGATQTELSAQAGPVSSDRAVDGKSKTGDLGSTADRAGITAGWREFRKSFVADGPTSITVTHPAAIGAWAIVALILCFLTGRRLRRTRNEAFAVALAVTASLALLLPIAYANLAAGAFLGLLLSFIADWTRAAMFDTRRRSGRSELVFVGAIILGLTIGVTRIRAAETNNDDRPQPAANIHRVLIPVDANRKQVGTKYYVSEQFLRILMSAGKQHPREQSQWLLTGASISGELRESTPTSTPASEPPSWIISFDIETLARDTTIVLPLVRSDANWNRTAMLDGIPLPLEWSDAKHCAVKVAEPGQYSLAVSFVPTTTTNDGKNQVALNMPPVRGVRYSLRVPEGITNVQVSGASIVVKAGVSRIISGELDETHRPTIAWPSRQAQQKAKGDASITELRWLRIERDHASLDLKYVLDGASDAPDGLNIEVDDAWQVINPDKSVADVQSKSQSGKHGLRIPLVGQSKDHQEAMLHLQLKTPPGLGNCRLPSIGLTGRSPNQRWFAVTSEPSLACESLDSTASIRTSNEFFKKWGSDSEGEAPQIVLSNVSDLQSTISIRPRETEPEIDESLSIDAGIQRSRILYNAGVTPASFGATQFAFTVPDELIVDDIVATIDSRQLPLRWSRPAGNRITIFFAEKVTKPYRLMLRGQIRNDASGKTHLPMVSASTSEGATQLVRIYREDGVHLTTEGLQPAAELTSETIEPLPADWQGRAVMVTYVDTATASTARIGVQPSHPQTTGNTLTTLFRESGTWRAEYRCELKVEDGDMDCLRLRIPDTWTGPFEIQSSIPATIDSKTVGSDAGYLAIRFTMPIAKGGMADVRIRSPLTSPKSAAVSVPSIVADAATLQQQFISVPVSVDNQPIAYTQVGVQSATLPQSLASRLPAGSEAHIFRIMNPQFQVAIQSQFATQSSPTIRLADTTVIADQSGGQLVKTRFVLLPQGLSECKLQLPADQDLLAVKLGDRPAYIANLDVATWELRLGAPSLPQVIEIISRRQSNGATAINLELQRPSLLTGDRPIPIELSLWSFGHASDSIPTLRGNAAAEVSAADQAALRFDREVSIVEAAKATAAELPAPDGNNWFLPWAAMLEREQSDARQALVATQLESSEVQVSRSSEEQIAHAAERLQKWRADCQKTLGDQAKPGSQDKANVTQASAASPISFVDHEWAFFVAEGGSDSVQLSLRPTYITATQSRIIGLWSIVSLLIVTMIIMRWPAATDLFCRWAHSLGILLGIAWWAWLWPSWLGLLIGAVSMWLALRSDWPGRAMRTEASTVLRATRSN